MNEALVKEVFDDEEFVKSLFQLETPLEVQSALKGKGIELSTDDIVKVRDFIAQKLESGKELTDDELAGVAGGVIGIDDVMFAGLIIGIVALGGGSLLGIAGTVAGSFLGTKW